jgi:hypothetical protein
MNKKLTADEVKTIRATNEHIDTVRENLSKYAADIVVRGQKHDESKNHSPELEIFTEYTPKLKDTVYGSDEYKGFLKEMKVALDHHYANNSHHPEHYENGIDGMTLIDIIEMLADWQASTKRTKDGDIMKSLEIQKERFGISDQLYNILVNTVKGT